MDVGGDSAALVGGLAVVLASLGYAIGGFYLKARFKDDAADRRRHRHDAGQRRCSSSRWRCSRSPAMRPGAGPIAAMAALGAGGTGLAFVIFYTLIADVGPAKASIVAYIAPVFAVIYGVAFRDEAFTLGTLVGMALILGGSWIAGQARAPDARAAGDRPRPARPPAPEVAA